MAGDKTIDGTVEIQPILNAVLDGDVATAETLAYNFFEGDTSRHQREQLNLGLQGISTFITANSQSTDAGKREKAARQQRAMQSVMHIAEQQNQENKALNDKIDKMRLEYQKTLYLIDELEKQGLLTPEQAKAHREALEKSQIDIEKTLREVSDTKALAQQNVKALDAVTTDLEDRGLYLGSLSKIREIDSEAVVISLETPLDTAKVGRYIVFKDENGEYQIKITTEKINNFAELVNAKATTTLSLEDIQPESLRQSIMQSIAAQENAGKKFGNDLAGFETDGYNNLLKYIYKQIENHDENNPSDKITRDGFVELLDALDKVSTSEATLANLETKLRELTTAREELLERINNNAIENGAAQIEIDRINSEYEATKKDLEREEIKVSDASIRVNEIRARLEQNTAEAKEVQQEVTETREEIIAGLQAKYASTDRKEILTSNYEDIQLRVGRNLLGLAKNMGITVDSREHALKFMEQNPNHKLTQAWNNYITAEIDGVTRPLVQDEAGLVYWVDVNNNNKEHLLDTKYYPEKYALAYDPDKPRFWFDETPMHPRFAEGFREKLDADTQLTTAQAIADTEVWVAQNQERRAEECITADSDEKLSECMSAFQDASAAHAPEIIQEMAIDTLTSWKQNIEDVTNSIRIPKLFGNEESTVKPTVTAASSSMDNHG